ncbi:MAG: hypothetical protein KAR37_01205 [Alphaproteobacteria bacterium]|nr:hypothetical protein [Alphaproteobacteria bacterium]
MKRFSGRAPAVAAAVAALIFAAPALSQPSGQGVEPIQVPKLGAADAAATCNLDTDFAVGQLLIDPVVDTTHYGDPYLGETLVIDVSVDTDSVSFNDLTGAGPSQQAGTRGVEAVIAGTKSNSPANVYCYINAESDTAIEAPGGETPTKLEFYWSRGPCLIALDDDVKTACYVYNGTPTGGPPADDPALDPLLQAVHYLQLHYVAPEEPINICGCPYYDGSAEVQRIAEFCVPSSDPAVQGACPTGTEGDGLTGLETQSTVTEGSATCQRVVIGGRSLFIGDTCE